MPAGHQHLTREERIWRAVLYVTSGIVLALAFLGAMASWNALPQPSRDASQRCSPDCNGKCQNATAQPEPSQQA